MTVQNVFHSFATFVKTPTAKVCIVSTTAAIVFATIGSLALYGLLLPHTALGIFTLHALTAKGTIGLVAGSCSLAFIGIGVDVLAICLHHFRSRLSSKSEKTIQGNETEAVFLSQSIGDYTIEFGQACDQNKNFRHSMEDETICGVDLGNGICFFAVLDGHGGVQTVQDLKKAFPEEMKRQIEKHPDNIEQVIKEAHSELDKKLTDESGSCAAAVTLTKDTIYFSNVGDSEIVTSQSGKAKEETKTHKAKTNFEEQTRIKNAGGRILLDKVNAQLAVTRAFGDQGLKQYGVIATPDITTKQLSELNKGDFIIIACDGLWDVIGKQEAVDLVKEMNNPQEMAQVLVNQALEKRSADNISVIVIKIKK